eukprot:6210800-Pleurochrysis_carterae.AAC.2
MSALVNHLYLRLTCGDATGLRQPPQERECVLSEPRRRVDNQEAERARAEARSLYTEANGG